MSDTEEKKSSDEILKELFHSLNLPVSPESDKAFKKELSETCATLLTPESETKKHKKSPVKNISPSPPITKKKLHHGSPKNESTRSRSKSKDKKSTKKKSKRKDSSSRHKHKSSSSSSNVAKSRSYSRSSSRHRSSSRSRSRHKRSESCSKARHDKSYSPSRSSHRHSRSKSKSKHRDPYTHSKSKSPEHRSYQDPHHRKSKNDNSSNYRYKSSKRRHSKDSISPDEENCSSKKKISHPSRSPSPKKRKSRSSSASKEAIKDPLDAWKEAKLAKLKKMGSDIAKEMNGAADENNIPIPLKILQSKCDESISVSLTSDASINLPDPSFIPLPNVLKEQNHNSEVPLDGNTATEGAKSVESAKDEDKPKGIVIKCLKDSLVIQQAEEEAKKKALETVIIADTLKEQNPENAEDSKTEEGEIVSGDEFPKKTDKNGSKKDHHTLKDKEKKRSKEKERKSHNKKHGRRHRSRSQSRHRKRSRSRSSERKSSRRRRSKSRSRDRSRVKKSPDCVDSLRDKATRKRLLEIARRNAVYLMKNNCLPPSIEKESLKATGKSVEELTNFCQQLVAKGEYSDADLSDPSLSEEDGEGGDKPFSGGRHPFTIKDSKPILMNIRNAPMLPTKTNAERLADTSKLREQFPVSSGSQHRTKESGWVPVKKEEKVKEEDIVFPEEKTMDISHVVSTRLSAMRRLQDNPSDRDAMQALSSAQNDMENWVLSKQVPGQFTGSTGARVMSQEELSAGYQAWARKEQFRETVPISSHFGLKMMQKMGWTPGEGLGKNKEGQLEPLLLDVKLDKKGLQAQQESSCKRAPIPLAKKLSGKHPVSALVELCIKRKWNPPEFEIVFDGGPDHKKNFLMKAIVNNQEYKPSIVTSTKKLAKANAAAACLQALGLIPKESAPKAQTLQTTPTEPSPLPEAPRLLSTVPISTATAGSIGPNLPMASTSQYFNFGEKTSNAASTNSYAMDYYSLQNIPNPGGMG